jgi:hypothetical protein
MVAYVRLFRKRKEGRWCLLNVLRHKLTRHALHTPLSVQSSVHEACVSDADTDTQRHAWHCGGGISAVTASSSVNAPSHEATYYKQATPRAFSPLGGFARGSHREIELKVCSRAHNIFG